MRFAAAAALLTFAAFIVVLPIFVPDADLIIICVFTIGLATYDFWSSAFRGRRNGSPS